MMPVVLSHPKILVDEACLAYVHKVNVAIIRFFPLLGLKKSLNSKSAEVRPRRVQSLPSVQFNGRRIVNFVHSQSDALKADAVPRPFEEHGTTPLSRTSHTIERSISWPHKCTKHALWWAINVDYGYRCRYGSIEICTPAIRHNFGRLIEIPSTGIPRRCH